MKFQPTNLEGAWLIEAEPNTDKRGAFVRTFCIRAFAENGLETNFVQHSLSYSLHTGTLRGMHFQEEPHGEVKLVSCVKGAIFDVIVDLRPSSPTRLRWAAFELSENNGRQLYIPKGFAHGFLTLCDNVTVNYLISEFHTPSAARGLRYDDPALAIEWPASPVLLSERDLGWPFVQAELV